MLTTGGTARDVQAIRALKDIFAVAFLKKDARLRASIWTEEGTLVPPEGGFFQGRESMQKHFATQASAITASSDMRFSNYRFRFITSDIAFVDVDIALIDIIGPDGAQHALLPIVSAFTAIRTTGKWWVQDERAYFRASPSAPARQ
jgi:uncharacterized protein (TIGR02246 family)